jgi:hypothetical protein
MKALIEHFYAAIRLQQAPPIPYSQIIATAEVMDRIFEQLPLDNPCRSILDAGEQPASRSVG